MCTVPKSMIASEIENYGELVMLRWLGKAQGRRLAASGTCKGVGVHCSPFL